MVTESMNTALAFAAVLAVVAAVAFVVWRTIGRTMLAVAGGAAEVPVGPGVDLFDEPVALLDGVRVGEIVRWHTDLLVGFESGAGTWTAPDHVPNRAGVPIAPVGNRAKGQLCFAHGASDRRTSRLLEQWRTEARILTAVLSRDGMFALVDPTTRAALLAEQLGATR